MNWYNTTKFAFPAKHNWTEDELEVIKELVNEGNSLQQIANLLGVWRGVIYSLDKKYKWKEKYQNKKDKWITNLYLLPPAGKGMSGIVLRKDYGIYVPAIKGALRRLNLSHLYRDVENRSTPEGSKRKKEKAIQQWKDPDYRAMVNKMYYHNPEFLSEKSRTAKNQWSKWGGLEGFLTSRNTKEDAIRWLDGFWNRSLKKLEHNTAYSIYSKYMNIINETTYPEDQETPPEDLIKEPEDSNPLDGEIE